MSTVLKHERSVIGGVSLCLAAAGLHQHDRGGVARRIDDLERKTSLLVSSACCHAIDFSNAQASERVRLPGGASPSICQTGLDDR